MTPQRRSIQGGILAFLAIGLVVAAAPAAAAQQSDTVQIDPGSHAAVKIDFRDGPTQDVSYDIQVQEGPNIDVLVMNNANYQKYRDGNSFDYIKDWSDLDTGNTDTQFTLQEHGTWWLVLDHSSEPDGGTQPATIGAESVTARYTVETQTNVEEETRSRLEEIPAPGLVTLLPAIAGAALVAVQRRA